MNISAIIIGREGSKGFPGKNTSLVEDYRMMEYPIMAALDSKKINKIYFSTDSRMMKEIARSYSIDVIDRPGMLATDTALAEDVFAHAYREARKEWQSELVVLMFANAPCVVGWMIDEMIGRLEKALDYFDSICTVSKYNMYAPARMRCLDWNNPDEIIPYGDDYECSTCDRDSVKNAYIYDCSCAVVKPRCLIDINEGRPPQRWLGKRVLGYVQKDPALDVDYEWQLGQVEWWIRRNFI